jgi:signal transduction histidine kinase
MSSRISRLPLRVRLVAGFSTAMLVLLVAAGGFVYWRVEYALDRGLDTELAQGSSVITPLVGRDGTVHATQAADATGLAWQVLGGDGTVLASGGPAPARAMIGAGRLRAGTYDLGSLLPVADAPYRVRVTALDDGADQRAAYLLVGVRRDHRDEALRELLAQLAIAGLGALALASLVGYLLARLALDPVEKYRRRADQIAAAGSPDLRLDVPGTRDDEVTRLGHTLNRMLEALQQALDRERQFVEDASHELRTPLTLLTSRIQLTRRRPRSVAEHEQALDELAVDVARLTALAEQLLELGSGGAPSREIVLDRIRTNLRDNAELHGAPPVEVRTARRDGFDVLTVADAGPGMPFELLATATERFARAPEARSRPGAGLGLALVAGLLTEAGGELRLCHAGQHTSHGMPSGLPCQHDDRMTATAYLPLP